MEKITIAKKQCLVRNHCFASMSLTSSDCSVMAKIVDFSSDAVCLNLLELAVHAM